MGFNPPGFNQGSDAPGWHADNDKVNSIFFDEPHRGRASRASVSYRGSWGRKSWLCEWGSLNK